MVRIPPYPIATVEDTAEWPEGGQQALYAWIKQQDIEVDRFEDGKDRLFFTALPTLEDESHFVAAWPGRFTYLG